MLSPKDVLVSTTSTIEGARILKYMNPISAHVVTGTNFFSDLFASFSDVFGGRSETYQRQLSSIYIEAVANLRWKAYELGANCIIGLSVDLDEISGKGKSMFMVTAIGTAVVLDQVPTVPDNKTAIQEKVENVSVEQLIILKQKKSILEQASADTLDWEDNIWSFITQNKILEIFPYILIKWKNLLIDNGEPDVLNRFYNKTVEYLAALPEDKKYEFVYNAFINEPDEQLVIRTLFLIRDLQLLNLAFVKEYLLSNSFESKKRAIKPLQYDKPFYNKSDIDALKEIISLINSSFPERGQRSFKKQLLSSKEKEVWTCECNKVNDIDDYCSVCGKDIYGFKETEVNPELAIRVTKEKIELIESCLK